MDTEQQIRLNFLDEAEEYFDRIESNLLGLSDALVDPHKVDLVLRSAHSIKGGAAMMSLNTLSHVAHRLEDFLKILRVRYTADLVDVEVETLLLQSVDCLRHLGSLNRQELSGINPENSHQQKEAVGDRIQPIFAKLQEYLGDLQASDENALLAQDEDVNPALLIFEEGVDEILDRFESQLPNLEITTLASELIATAQELMGFGNMANLESFTQLCESIRQEAGSLSSVDMPLLAEQSLKTWRRSHALVLRGSIDKLPTCLENLPATSKSEPISREPDTFALAFDKAIDFEATSEEEQETDNDELFLDDAFDFVELHSAFDSE
ncbi:MAG: Hpt domain-containing protein, partial [Cyanobacteria bacterium J06621_12]